MIKIFNFLKNRCKWIALSLAIIIIAALSTVCTKQHTRIKDYKAEIVQLKDTNKDQAKLITELATMEAIHCEVAVTIKNTAVMGKNQIGSVNQDAKQIAYYLRGEILDSLMKKR